MRGGLHRADTGAIVLAAGQGLRFGGRIRKQYLALDGKPLLWWSLRAFQQSPSIVSIVLVVPADDLHRLRRQSAGWKFSKLSAVTAGGTTRAQSVLQGLKALPEDVSWVAVHDSARPLATPDLIEEVLTQALLHRAAIAACPSADTVKIADGKQKISATPLRETVWLAQTPQIFNRRLLERAHAVFGGKKIPTDDAQVVERLGVRVHLVHAPRENLKVTTPIDLEIAKFILKQRKGVF